ncbi:sigma-70 family RNA polymerase sigma factor [Actinobacillus equuli subsp. equuli]|uniref:RNA polymerase sigma factor n=2 Tax=Actinobacillus equuli TaxID=718 RepID=A0A0A7MM74_ACTEU|nr:MULTISPECIES: sigma-70 family RNA polymerase sigma factor [Actinobacillus]AIZ79836.1 RNA polymerase sigma factor [Actinobacillus equuli subsp. equuli]MCQ9712519.1 sigma-70 family RNA polymerase sigma factor [Actinobacillus suis]MDE8035325.1 sigma-70 family RNA polymerase sigma factor [Actinobacillus equuli subsp. equuli]MDG4947621.1 sigma-70 family RNA polymerase sigma factor [Actinobacillus equuli subsp. haemolyticus]MDG4953069.1 sigma-70 family RNA polymerase sigma factor [Actinobacillus 
MSQIEQLNSITPQKIEEIRLQMIKFATLQLRDPDLAEDVVQEALMSAYKSAHSFRGQAALKTWIFAILKNKIIDLIKYRKRTVNVSELMEEESPNQFFDHSGYWSSETYEPREWEDVNQITYKKEFWAIFDICLNKLPAQQARVFMMREHLEMSSEHICLECGITTANLHVILHRARLQLQACLARNWFEGEKE